MKTLFVPGLWFNPAGGIAQTLKRGKIEILSQVDLPSLSDRVKNLTSAILRNRYSTLIAHSAGCAVLAQTLQEKDFGNLIKRVIFLNPAPTAGVQFTPMDPIFWVMPSYFKSMFTGKDFMLSRKHAMNLLSTPSSEIDAVMKNLTEDSGEFAKELTLMQFKKKFVLREFSQNTHVSVVSCTKDRMVGSTWKKTEDALSKRNKAVIIRYAEGHLWTLQNIGHVLQDLQVEIE